MTLTTHSQPAGACTTTVCAPVVDCVVTDCPEGPDSLTAGVPDGVPPTGVTKTANDGPEAGAGVQRNAQPMFHPAAVVVNAGLVQFPVFCVGPMSTRAGPAAADGGAVVEVAPPAATVVVVVEPLAAVVVVDDEPTNDGDVVVVLPLAPCGGRWYAGAVDAVDDVPTSL